MKTNSIKAAIFGAAVASLTIAPTQAAADNSESSIEYAGGKRAYDRKIEQAAIRRAANKIGDLRGSLEGFKDGYITLESELKGPQSSRLGFPIVSEPKA